MFALGPAGLHPAGPCITTLRAMNSGVNFFEIKRTPADDLMPICPCCGAEADAEKVIRAVIKGPVARRLALVLAERRGQWLRADELVELTYGPRQDGGATQNAIAVVFSHMRRQLFPYGIRLEGRSGGSRSQMGRRMVW